MEVLTSVDSDLMLGEQFDNFGNAFDATVRTIIDGASVENTQESLRQWLRWQTAITCDPFLLPRPRRGVGHLHIADD